MRKPIMTSSMCYSLLSIFLCLLLQEPTTQAIKQSYIVYLGSHAFGQNPSSVDLEFVTNSHYKLLGSYLGSIEKAKEAIFYSYNRYFNGFAAILEEEEASKIAKNPSVLSVFLNQKRKLHTTRSWSFLGLEENNGVISNHSIWSNSLGEDIIIANLDTGVWPESKSFSDEGMRAIPKRWRGICQTENNNPDNFHCNRKLIGARYFFNSIKADSIKEHNFFSPRDYNGHGSHTLSTAGGNFVQGANILGNGNGTASGGSPKARVAAYKVCWGGGSCYDADILAGFEAAIGDGVDVISVSLGGNPTQDYFDNAIAIGSFHAVAHNIIVVSSAGNFGPTPQTVSNSEPWVITVAASTIDRKFTNYIMLGDKKILKGTSLSEFGLPSNKLYPLIQAFDARASGVKDFDALFCKEGALDPKKVKGKIVICINDLNNAVEEGVVAARAGAVGMILVNDEIISGNEIQALPHVLPASNVNVSDGDYIFSYINRTKSPMASISKVETELGKQPNPFVAYFSSRGPNFIAPEILKPDITAPGVNIIAASSEAISTPGFDIRMPFFMLSGTSMSCPHVSGLAGLIKSLHPDWSPAAIKSAIMTTASTTDNTGKPMLNSSLAMATPFDYGAGHIQPNLAADPGLVYDLNKFDYLNFLCGLGYDSANLTLFYGKNYTCPKSFNIADLNYPSITVEFDNRHSIINVTRTLTNVGSPSIYRVRMKEPEEVEVSVEPNILSFKKKGEKKVFRVTLALRSPGKYKAKYFFGGLDWTDGKHHVNSPIVVKYPSE